MKHLLKKVIVKNFFNLSLNQVLNTLISILLIPFIFQNIGDENFGLVNLALSIVYLLSIVATYGFNLNGPKLISVIKNDKIALEKLLNEIISLRLFLSVIITFIVIIIYLFIGEFDNYSILLLSSLIVLFSEAIYPIFYLQGKDEINILVVLNLISKILYFILIILLIKSPRDAFLVNFLLGLTCLFSYYFFWVIIYRKKQYKWEWSSLKKIKSQIKVNFDYFIITLGSYIILNGGIIILSNYVDDSELGQFSLSQKVGLQLRMIPVFFVQSILQKAAIFHEKKDEKMDAYINKIFILGIFSTIFVSIFMIFLSKHIIYYLSGKYIPYSENILIILSFIPLLAMLNYKNMIIILAKDMKATLNKASFLTFAFMLFFSIFLSKLFGGLGLAYALILSELFSFFVHYYLINKNKK